MNTPSSVLAKVMGVLMMGFSVTYWVPVFVAWLYGEDESIYFIITFIFMFLSGLIIWLLNRNSKNELRTRHGFILVTLFWTILGLYSAIPLYLIPLLNISFAQATFEAISGFTSAGASILSNLDHMPKSILFYRAQLQFLGGMGIVVLAVAIMPLLGMGGMALYKAETPGPMKDDKLTPRIAQTARALWIVYVILCMACTLAYYIGGMTFFDAITHSFTTVATGGFSNYDKSLAYFNSAFIEWVAIIFMFLGGINFGVHFIAFKTRNFYTYFKDTEFSAYIYCILILSLIIMAVLLSHGIYENWFDAFRTSLLHLVSFMTTTGFSTANYADWPLFVPILLTLSCFLGGCTGSTAGGIKIIRGILLVKQFMREIHRLIHPRAVIHVRIGDKNIDENILGGVWAFLGLYAICTGFLTLVMMGLGLPAVDAFSSIAATLNVTGLGIGGIAKSFNVGDTGLWVLNFSMLLGRLEIFTVFVLLTPAFWKN